MSLCGPGNLHQFPLQFISQPTTHLVKQSQASQGGATHPSKPLTTNHTLLVSPPPSLRSFVLWSFTQVLKSHDLCFLLFCKAWCPSAAIVVASNILLRLYFFPHHFPSVSPSLLSLLSFSPSSLLLFCHSSSVCCCCLVWSDFAQTRLALGKVRSPESLLRSPQVASTMNTLWSPFPSCCHGSSFRATRRLGRALLIHRLEKKFWEPSFDQSPFFTSAISCKMIFSSFFFFVFKPGKTHLLYINITCILKLSVPPPCCIPSFLPDTTSLPFLTSVAPPRHCSSAKAALHTAPVPALWYSAFLTKEATPRTFYCFLFFFGGWCIKHGASGRGCWVGSHVPLNGQPCACA